MKYIGFYSPRGISKYERAANLASQAKMDYVVQLLSELGNEVEIVSPSWIVEKRNIREKKIISRIGDNTVLTLAPSFSSGNRLLRGIAVIYSLLWLFFYLLRNTKRNETVVAYHVQWIAYPLVAAKKIKKLNLILEVEELYQQIWQGKPLLNRMENTLIKCADSYIVSTDLLLESLPHKPSVTIYGNYCVSVKEDRPIKKDNEKILLVYAGIIDKVKGGAFLAVDSCLFLPEKYELKVIGFGGQQEIENLKKTIDEVNRKLCRDAVEYCGTKRGSDYSDFIKKMDIGLNPQIVSEFDRVEFPSKVISYMSFGLNVVSTPLQCLSCSKISDIVYFSSDDSPKQFAYAIEQVVEKKQLSRIQRLYSLHTDTKKALRLMIGE